MLSTWIRDVQEGPPSHLPNVQGAAAPGHYRSRSRLWPSLRLHLGHHQRQKWATECRFPHSAATTWLLGHVEGDSGHGVRVGRRKSMPKAPGGRKQAAKNLRQVRGGQVREPRLRVPREWFIVPADFT